MSDAAGRRRVVIVTGTPRSGTTPVGDTLALAARTCSLYEPMNFHVGDKRIGRYFEVPGAAGFTEQDCFGLLADVRDLRLRLRPGLFPDDHGPRRLVKRVTGSQTLASYRRCRLHPRLCTIVWKDPFAVFLAPVVAAAEAVPVVVTVRPPAAVAASFKRLGWTFDVSDLVARLPGGDADYRTLLAGLDLTAPAVNAAALWHVVYRRLLTAAGDLDGIHIVDMDRLVGDRIGTFRRVFERVGLAWTDRVQRLVGRTGGAGGPARPTGTRAHGGRRDVSAVNAYWREVLDAAEVDLVHRLNADLWAHLQAASL